MAHRADRPVAITCANGTRSKRYWTNGRIGLIGAPISPQEMERLAKRRFQNPRPERRGAWWTMRVWRDEFINGKHVRKQQRVRLAATTVSGREVKKTATENLRPLNQGLESLGSATNFEHYIETIYKPVVKPLMATTSFDRTRGVLDLLPAFGKCCLRDLTALTLQTSSRSSRRARQTKSCRMNRETRSVTYFRVRYVSLCSMIC
jgi:hypothetical protein